MMDDSDDDDNMSKDDDLYAFKEFHQAFDDRRNEEESTRTISAQDDIDVDALPDVDEFEANNYGDCPSAHARYVRQFVDRLAEIQSARTLLSDAHTLLRQQLNEGQQWWPANNGKSCTCGACCCAPPWSTLRSPRAPGRHLQTSPCAPRC